MKNQFIGVLPLLGIAFVILKLTNFIDWSWWWVTIPFWGSVVLVIIVQLLVALFFYFAKKKWL